MVVVFTGNKKIESYFKITKKVQKKINGNFHKKY